MIFFITLSVAFINSTAAAYIYFLQGETMAYKKNNKNVQSAEQSTNQNKADRAAASKRSVKQKKSQEKTAEQKKQSKTNDKRKADKKTTAKATSATGRKNDSAKQKNDFANQKQTPKKQQTTAKNNSSKDLKKKAAGLSRYGSISPKELRKTGGVKIAFLGGINEIGKNLTVFEYENEMIILDCGMSFPDADMPGIDYVIPDFSYIERNADKIKALFITHGHEDHIGAVPYFLKSVNVPVYATKLTVGLIEGKLREHRMLGISRLNVISPGDIIETGAFTVEAIHVNHSIPDSLAYAVKCSAGVIVHTGDFKIDNTPIDGGVMDLARFAVLGNEGVMCLMADSTNAERIGYTPSERMVGETLASLFMRAAGKRIVVASFASNIHRIQQILDSAKKTGRKVFLSGRSLENVSAVSQELGYLNVPDDIIVSIDKLKNYRDEDVVIITTGSQGEPMSALSRMALGDHRKVTIGSNDFVIISATPIPGNEKTVANTINDLMKLGAEVVYEKNLGIHVSGHAAQEELKLVMNLVRPQFFIPVHGEQKHMRKHARLAESVGIPQKNIMVPDLGSVIEVSHGRIRQLSPVTAGRVFVDGSGVGDVGSEVLRDRKKLSTDGIVIVTAITDAYSGELISPLEISSKGFVFINNANELNGFITDACERVLEKFVGSVNMDITALKTKLKDSVTKTLFDKTKRSPVVIVNVFAV